MPDTEGAGFPVGGKKGVGEDVEEDEDEEEEEDVLRKGPIAKRTTPMKQAI